LGVRFLTKHALKRRLGVTGQQRKMPAASPILDVGMTPRIAAGLRNANPVVHDDFVLQKRCAMKTSGQARGQGDHLGQVEAPKPELC
jgi:hypothetical protein